MNNIHNNFWDFRKHIFNSHPHDLGVASVTAEHQVYAVVMDIGDAEGVISISTLTNGEAFLHTESGFSITGGGMHQNVIDAVDVFLQYADSCVPSMSYTDKGPLPDVGNVAFYVLTTSGVLTKVIHETNLTDPHSLYGRLYALGNKVFTQLRIATEKNIID